MEGRLGEVARGPVLGVDLDRPREVARTPEQLLVEVVADAPDRLRDEQSGRGRVEEQRDVGAGPVHAPDPDERAERDPAPMPRPPCQTANGPHQRSNEPSGVVAR